MDAELRLRLIAIVQANWIETVFPTDGLTGLKHAKCLSERAASEMQTDVQAA